MITTGVKNSELGTGPESGSLAGEQGRGYLVL